MARPTGGAPAASPSPSQLLSAAGVCALLGVSRAAFYATVRSHPEFPCPAKRGQWIMGEVEAFALSRPRGEGWVTTA